MKRFILILSLILLCCLTIFLTSSLPVATPNVTAESGVLDLRGADFQSSVYGLDGEWELYYNRLYTPEQLQAGVPEAVEYIALPEPWTSVEHPALGYATFRLTIQTDREEPLLLYIPEIMSSAIIWSNGDVLYRAGQPGASAGETVTGVRNEILVVTPRQGQIELVVQAANYHMNGSGLFYRLLLGRDTVVLHKVFAPRMVVAAVLGGILLIGIYHLVLFLFRRRDRIYLSFSVTCLLTVLRLGMESNAFVQYFRPGGIDYVLSRVFLLLFTAHSMSIVVFMLLAFSIRLSKGMRVLFLSCLLIPVAAICFAPYALAVALMFLIMIPFIIAIVKGFRSWMAQKNNYQLLYLVGSFIFLIYGSLGKTLLEGELFVPATVPNLFLILTQCVMLSQSYVAAHDEVERANETLEATVEERTAELQVALARVAHSERSIKELIGNISHDLRTPLTVVSLELQRLIDPTSRYTEEDARRMLSIAYNKTQDMQRLTQNLFDAARMEEGQVAFHMSWMRLSDLMEMLYDRYNDYVENEGRLLAIRYGNNMDIWLDRENIWTVFANILGNALRYTPQDGVITVTAQQAGPEHVELTIRDSGCGIAPEHLPRIFDRHYKADKSRGQGGESGLGLYIVKNVVERMDGTVRAISPPGEGTSIIVTLRARDVKKDCKKPVDMVK